MGDEFVTSEGWFRTVDDIDHLSPRLRELVIKWALRRGTVDARERTLALRAENERLRTFIDGLGITVMHPNMAGEHQARIHANGRRLTLAEWAIVSDCRPAASPSTETTP